MPHRCAFGCGNDNTNVVMHMFPNPTRYPERFQAWMNLLKNKIETLSEDQIYIRKRICDIHFSARHRNRFKRLNALAIPTLHLPAEVFNTKDDVKPAIAVSISQTHLTVAATGTPCLADASDESKAATDLNITPPDSRKGTPCLADASEDSKSASDSDITPRDLRKVLQLRLLEDNDYDEPIYEVIPDKPPMMKVSVTTQSADVDVQNKTLEIQKKTSETEDIEVKIKTEEECSDKDVWKQKLALVLHTRQFCGVCLCGGGGLSALSDRLEILDGHCTTYGHVVETVFKENYVSLANSQICNNCAEKLIKSYTFIRDTVETWKKLNNDLDELYNKTCFINNKNYVKDDSAGSKIYNVVIALDRGKPENFTYNNMTTEEPKSKQNHPHQPRDRRRFKCLSCNVSLPSYGAWKLHEATTHRKYNRCRICLQSLKTRQDLTAHYRTHLKSRCSVCHKTVQDGILELHMKKCHKHSVHWCSTCNVAFYSAKALESHKSECHYSDDSKCATCLLSLSEIELEEHQCRFKCPECIELPCVHHKYLMSYREQMLNLAPRARCLHCSYVCTSKGALVTHVNARHLNVQPYSCTNCGDKFYSASNLRSHICGKKKRHKYSHLCEYCDRPFTYRKMWQQHRKNCERIQRQFQCEYCPANFDSSKDLCHHRKVKHGKDKFSCEFCDREFLNAKKRNKHTMLSHERAALPQL